MSTLQNRSSKTSNINTTANITSTGRTLNKFARGAIISSEQLNSNFTTLWNNLSDLSSGVKTVQGSLNRAMTVSQIVNQSTESIINIDEITPIVELVTLKRDLNTSNPYSQTFATSFQIVGAGINSGTNDILEFSVHTTSDVTSDIFASDFVHGSISASGMGSTNLIFWYVLSQQDGQQIYRIFATPDYSKKDWTGEQSIKLNSLSVYTPQFVDSEIEVTLYGDVGTSDENKVVYTSWLQKNKEEMVSDNFIQVESFAYNQESFVGDLEETFQPKFDDLIAKDDELEGRISTNETNISNKLNRVTDLNGNTSLDLDGAAKNGFIVNVDGKLVVSDKFLTEYQIDTLDTEVKNVVSAINELLSQVTELQNAEDLDGDRLTSLEQSDIELDMRMDDLEEWALEVNSDQDEQDERLDIVEYTNDAQDLQIEQLQANDQAINAYLSANATARLKAYGAGGVLTEDTTWHPVTMVKADGSLDSRNENTFGANITFNGITAELSVTSEINNIDWEIQGVAIDTSAPKTINFRLRDIDTNNIVLPSTPFNIPVGSTFIQFGSEVSLPVGNFIIEYNVPSGGGTISFSSREFKLIKYGGLNGTGATNTDELIDSHNADSTSGTSRWMAEKDKQILEEVFDRTSLIRAHTIEDEKDYIWKWTDATPYKPVTQLLLSNGLSLKLSTILKSDTKLDVTNISAYKGTSFVVSTGNSSVHVEETMDPELYSSTLLSATEIDNNEVMTISQNRSKGEEVVTLGDFGLYAPALTTLKNGNVFAVGGDGDFVITTPDGTEITSGRADLGRVATVTTLNNGNVFIPSDYGTNFAIFDENGTEVSSGTIDGLVSDARATALQNGNVFITYYSTDEFIIVDENGVKISSGTLTTDIGEVEAITTLKNGNVFIISTVASKFLIVDENGVEVTTGDITITKDYMQAWNIVTLQDGNLFFADDIEYTIITPDGIEVSYGYITGNSGHDVASTVLQDGNVFIVAGNSGYFGVINPGKTTISSKTYDLNGEIVSEMLTDISDDIQPIKERYWGTSKEVESTGDTIFTFHSGNLSAYPANGIIEQGHFMIVKPNGEITYSKPIKYDAISSIISGNREYARFIPLSNGTVMAVSSTTSDDELNTGAVISFLNFETGMLENEVFTSGLILDHNTLSFVELPNQTILLTNDHSYFIIDLFGNLISEGALPEISESNYVVGSQIEAQLVSTKDHVYFGGTDNKVLSVDLSNLSVPVFSIIEFKNKQHDEDLAYRPFNIMRSDSGEFSTMSSNWYDETNELPSELNVFEVFWNSYNVIGSQTIEKEGYLFVNDALYEKNPVTLSQLNTKISDANNYTDETISSLLWTNNVRVESQSTESFSGTAANQKEINTEMAEKLKEIYNQIEVD